MKRRDFLISGAAGLVAPLMLPRRIWADDTLDLGNLQLQTLSDGNLVLPGDFILGGMPQD